jgi:hypothetical protein
MTRTLLALSLSALLLGGCAFVETTDSGEKVRVLDSNEVSTCKRLGLTRVTVLESIAGVPRPAETIQDELDTLARNSASDMGGDTVVRTAAPIAGEQTFNVYKCIDPNG